MLLFGITAPVSHLLDYACGGTATGILYLKIDGQGDVHVPLNLTDSTDITNSILAFVYNAVNDHQPTAKSCLQGYLKVDIQTR